MKLKTHKRETELDHQISKCTGLHKYRTKTTPRADQAL